MQFVRQRVRDSNGSDVGRPVGDVDYWVQEPAHRKREWRNQNCRRKPDVLERQRPRLLFQVVMDPLGALGANCHRLQYSSDVLGSCCITSAWLTFSRHAK